MTSKASLYTGYGDKGCTFTKKNPKTPKTDKLICLIGEIDDLNSHIGYLVSSIINNKLISYNKKNSIFYYLIII